MSEKLEALTNTELEQLLFDASACRDVRPSLA